jgi:hypothetical protein
VVGKAPNRRTKLYSNSIRKYLGGFGGGHKRGKEAYNQDEKKY